MMAELPVGTYPNAHPALCRHLTDLTVQRLDSATAATDVDTETASVYLGTPGPCFKLLECRTSSDINNFNCVRRFNVAHEESACTEFS